MMLILFFFFFKQKTAYEIGWCDWSSDVCSSDLIPSGGVLKNGTNSADNLRQQYHKAEFETRSEERRVGKECPSSVDLGGRRIIKKKKKKIKKNIKKEDKKKKTNIKKKKN